jgi:hypothetical protein
MDELEKMSTYGAGFEDGKRQAKSDEAWNETEVLILLLRSLSHSLKKRGYWIWILPQTIYFLYCFAFPTLLGQSIIWLIFKPSHEKPAPSFTLISWIIGLAIGGYYYLLCEGKFKKKGNRS